MNDAMTHAEMVEEVIKLHEWVKHWSQRAEAAEKALATIAHHKYRNGVILQCFDHCAACRMEKMLSTQPEPKPEAGSVQP